MRTPAQDNQMSTKTGGKKAVGISVPAYRRGKALEAPILLWLLHSVATELHDGQVDPERLTFDLVIPDLSRHPDVPALERITADIEFLLGCPGRVRTYLLDMSNSILDSDPRSHRREAPVNS